MVSSLNNENSIKRRSCETSNQSLLTFTSWWNFYFSIVFFSLSLFHDPGKFLNVLSIAFLFSLELSLFNVQWHFHPFKGSDLNQTFLRHFHFSMSASLSDEIPSKTCCFETLNQSLKIQFNFSHPSDFCETLTWL